MLFAQRFLQQHTARTASPYLDSAVQGFDKSNVFGYSVALDSLQLMVGAPGVFFTHAGTGIYNYRPGYAFEYNRRASDNQFYVNKVIADNESVITSGGNTMFGNAVGISHGNFFM